VSYVLGDEPDQLELSVEDAKVTRLFVEGGLVPALRFRPSTEEPETRI
jgi:hypothetical protein